ncbi:MAG: pyridoxal phosphate-dependent aminotransferase [Geminicoccaceae bacterium]
MGKTTMRYSSRSGQLGGPAADNWGIHYEATARRREGHDVILLTVGDPDQPTPDAVAAEAKASIDRGHTRYAAVAGQENLRRAIAAHHKLLTGQTVDPSQVTVFAGAQCALFAACQLLLDPGSEAIVLEPAYLTYRATVGATGADAVPVPLRPERGFHLDPAELEAAITPATRAILINSPNNPTGAVMRRAELEAVAEACRRHDLWLISDEVYAGLVFEGEHLSPVALPGMAERTVVVSSLSKSHMMTGWRVGWLIGPQELARHAANLALAMLYGSPGFIQDAATVALTTALTEPAAAKETLRRRRDAVVRRLGQLPGLACTPPAAGMFLMLDVRGTGLDAMGFARGLLDSEAVAVLPADAFGGAAEGHVRMSLTVPEDRLAEACNRIGRFVFRLGATSRRLATG